MDIIVDSSIKAFRNSTHYGNEFLSRGDIHPKYIKSLALRALTKLNECVDEYIDKVIESLSDETDMDVILCVFSIISRCSNPDNYFKYAVDRFEKAERSYIYLRFDEAFLNIIISLRSLTSMIESIKYMCESCLLYTSPSPRD